MVTVLTVCRYGDAVEGAERAYSQTPIELLDKLWKALKENYPMMEYAGAFDESWHEEFKEKLDGISDMKVALPILERLVDRLDDYHTNFFWEGKAHVIGPPVQLGLVENQLAVIDRDRSLSIERGDVVSKIDGDDALDRFKELFPITKGATRYAKAGMTCGRIIAGTPGSSVTLVLENPEKGEYEVTLERTGWSPPGPKSILYSRPLGSETGYIKIKSWGRFKAGEFDERLELLRDHPYLIIDVRDNGGGSDHLAELVIGRFIEKPVVCSISFIREAGTDTYKKVIATAGPRGDWQYDGVVAVLINEGCCSATEHFVSGMYEAGAILVGTPTTGACGWSKKIDLGDGIALSCSLTFPMHGKVPSPLHGMKPHVLVQPTLADVRKGHDTVLTAALDLFKNKDYEKYVSEGF